MLRKNDNFRCWRLTEMIQQWFTKRLYSKRKPSAKLCKSQKVAWVLNFDIFQFSIFHSSNLCVLLEQNTYNCWFLAPNKTIFLSFYSKQAVPDIFHKRKHFVVSQVGFIDQIGVLVQRAEFGSLQKGSTSSHVYS